MSTPHSSAERAPHRCPYHIPTCTGSCQGAAVEVDTQGNLNPTADLPQYHRSPFTRPPGGDIATAQRSLSTSPLSSRSSPSTSMTSRLQMQEAFLRVYFPACRAGNETDLIFTKMLDRECLQASDPAMDAAVNALCLYQLGAAHADLRLFQEAQRQYAIAAARFEAAVSSQAGTNREQILGAGYILGFCDFIFPSPSSPRAGMQPPQPASESVSRTHFAALRDLLLQMGSEPTNFSTPFSQLLVYNIRHVLGLRSCCLREEAVFSGPAWRTCAAMVEPFMGTLSDHVLALPALLQQADLVLSHIDDEEDVDAPAGNQAPGPSPDVAEVLQRLAHFERSLQQWLLEWYQSFPDMPYRTVNLAVDRQFTHFTRHFTLFPSQSQETQSPGTRPHAHATPSTKALMFPSFSRGSAHATYWTLLLLTKHSIITLSRVLRDTMGSERDDDTIGRSSASAPVFPLPEATLVRDTAETVARLAESVPWLTMPSYGLAGGLAARFVLCALQRWFEWCQEEASARVKEEYESADEDSSAENDVRMQLRGLVRWCTNVATVLERRDPTARIWLSR